MSGKLSRMTCAPAIWLLAWTLACTLPAESALTLIPPSAMATASLDFDGDGLMELNTFQVSGDVMSSQIQVDAVNTPIQFPDDVFVGINLRRFDSSSALITSTIFSGDFTAQTDLDRMSDDATGGLFILASEPILAGWIYGTSGSDAADVHLIGMVIDAIDYFSSGGTADLKVYHYDFGAFGPGESLANATLASTSYPSRQGPLPSTSEFDGPRRGRILVPTILGKTYQLMRGPRPGEGTAILTRPGTGAVETFPWDDSASTDPCAFFWVQENDT